MENARQPSQPEADPAAAVFAQLVEEVGVVRRLVAANDNTATLGEIVQRLDKLVEVIRVLSRRPAMTLTPDEMATQIAAAAEKARAEDHAAMRQAREQMEKSAQLMETQRVRTAAAREQRRHLLWTGCGSVLAGALLWSFLPGTIARGAPASWHWPERMARHIVEEPTLWQAGTRIMSADNPTAWQTIVQAMQLRRENRESIDGCEDRATKMRRSVPCTLMIQSQANIPARSR